VTTDPRTLIRARPECYNRAACLTENLFRNGAEEELARSLSSPCAKDKEIDIFLLDDLSQFRPDFAATHDEFVSNADESATPNKRILQPRSISQNRLFAGGNGSRTRYGQTQGGNHMR
jgi:hypothetical protein